MTTRLCVDTYRRFAEYPADLLLFATQHALTLPSLTAKRGQALALLAQPEIRGQQYVDREGAEIFLRTIGEDSQDAIQAFNKATGLKRMPMKGRYCLQFPFECDKTDLVKRKGATISGDRDACIQAVKDWWRVHLVDVPNAEWQVGHLDPTVDDASEKNLAYQPPLQGKYRNRFKWDPYFHKMWPTAAELVPKMDEYYTEKEQREMYEVLAKKFAPQLPAPQESAATTETDPDTLADAFASSLVIV